MTDFVELQGASGAYYRFRRAEPDDLPATAGNAIVATGTPERLKVVYCAAARSFSRAAPELRERLSAHPSAKLYIRLNVSRVTREAEHGDLVAGLSPEAHADDLG